ncbi:hypothetical protein HK104_002499, partial [Borealophlyctis nickersoniae]
MVRSMVTGDVDLFSYREIILPDLGLTAKNSTSLQREPAAYSEFVRGRTTNFPFAPGGLEAVALVDQPIEKLEREIEDLFGVDEGEILSVPPGFERGLIFEDQPIEQAVKKPTLNIHEVLLGEDEVISHLLQEPERQEKPSKSPEGEALPNAIGEDKPEKKDVDELLPVRSGVPVTAPKPVKVPQREWAHVIDVNQDFPDFYDLVPELAHQKQAVYHLENSESVFIAAHTSAGKTVVAEYAIALAQKHMTRAVYTSPIKALSNQKFRDFRQTFDDVGILTGDVQIKPEASCLVMTTEILRSMLYRGADLIRDVEFVIFDEVHYVNDIERGVVWEEVIIMLPAHVTLILLSATVPNTKEFADWVGRTKQKDIYVISTLKRPVPLEHFLYVDKEIYKIVDANKKFLATGWKSAHDALTSTRREAARND